jgi:hypothetical protein
MLAPQGILMGGILRAAIYGRTVMMKRLRQKWGLVVLLAAGPMLFGSSCVVDTYRDFLLPGFGGGWGFNDYFFGFDYYDDDYFDDLEDYYDDLEDFYDDDDWFWD